MESHAIQMGLADVHATLRLQALRKQSLQRWGDFSNRSGARFGGGDLVAVGTCLWEGRSIDGFRMDWWVPFAGEGWHLFHAVQKAMVLFLTTVHLF